MKFAVYGRISRDRVGAGLGVERQIADCRELVRALSGEVAAVFRDDDISAYSGKHRPGYEALLEAIKNREVDAVAVWHQDRLLRRTIDLENYIEVCQPLNVATHTVKAGQLDLTTPAGRAVAKTLAAWASYEVETSTDRVKAAKLQAAKAGKSSGGNRAYGWLQNGMEQHPDEAPVVREIIKRFISGDSWNSIALDLNERNIPTAKGKMWTAINVSNVAQLPRHYGFRSHNGQEYKAAWEPLLSQDTREDLLLAIKRGQAIHGKRTYARKHLLTGFIFCGVCGNKMSIINAQQRDGSYSPAFNCRKKDHRGQEVGCGKVKRKKDPVEDLVIDCIMYRLDTPELGELLAGGEAETPELKQLMRDHESQSQRLQEILSLYSTGEMDFNEYKVAKTTAQDRLEALGRELERKTSKRTVANIPAGQTVREAWEKSDLMWKRQLVDALIEKVLIYPKQPGDGKARYKQWIFNPDRVEIRWKA
ncbi:recombinase family protein [Paenarthrobacter sp. MSM-2-10-13]|uniref:recombinase family protein n=1 Tax=Paenarthrobacter sp. MSM-2-10-13 TaxID=2717318 RepID=UPI00141DC1DE|nr:recombinase family protein [Paenarthrobacter sp. MSM-2-10-13]NHW45988.1 recombinase family protein [Paenarthrobacter sp. MSM-2-10-13]